jgi:protein SCO1/2
MVECFIINLGFIGCDQVNKIMRCLLLAAWIATLVGCSSASDTGQFKATDISGADFGQALNLTDHTGKPRTLADFKGKVVALFFGYTHCPDVCPTTMADMRQVTKLLGSHADEMQVLFVTLDPERDTKEVLAQYVPGFDKRFIGLYGTNEEVAAAVRDFKIFAAKVESKGRSGYTIDHSAGVYLFDKTGKIRLYVDYGAKPADVASDVQKLL